MRATASRLPHACIYGRYHRGYAVGVAQSTQSSHRLPPFELPPRGSSGVSWLPQGRGRHRSDFGLTAFIRPRHPAFPGVYDSSAPPGLRFWALLAGLRWPAYVWPAYVWRGGGGEDGGFWAECVGMWDFFCNFAGVI
jgi:hypothetical protein